MNISINQDYKGFYEVVATDPDGTNTFSSVQSTDVLPIREQDPPILEVTAVTWSVDPNGALSGRAIFHSVKTHDQVKALLVGKSPEPPPGQGFRIAIVRVTFTDGTGVYRGAQGTADVEAKLFDDGSSEGRIKGVVRLNGDQT